MKRNHKESKSVYSISDTGLFRELSANYLNFFSIQGPPAGRSPSNLPSTGESEVWLPRAGQASGGFVVLWGAVYVGPISGLLSWLAVLVMQMAM